MSNLYITSIDVVYVWCGLPEKKRCSFTPDLGYSVKSVKQNLIGFRRIWIIVDDDVSSTHLKEVGIDVNENNIDIRIIHHSKIIPKTYLPILWNSNVIESWIWKIRGLSEKFIYMCDDMYIGKRTNVNELFSDTYPIIRVVQGPPNHRLTPYKPSNDYIEMWQSAVERHGIHYTRHAHNAQPYKRSLLKRYYMKYKDDIHKASRNSTRNGKKDFNLLRFSGSLAIMEGHAILQATDPITHDLFVESNDKRKIRDILKLKPTFFCINNTNKNQTWVYEMLDMYFG